MISNIENYLYDILQNKENIINNDIYNDYKKFNYNNKELFVLHLDFLLNNFYKNIKIKEINISNKRLNQDEFRNLLLNKYKKCIITNNNCIDELEACHIVEFKNGGKCNVNNGFLLERNIHATFDKNVWCINPDTLLIEIKNGIKCIGTISKYKNLKINLKLNNELYNNLLIRYNNFIRI